MILVVPLRLASNLVFDLLPDALSATLRVTNKTSTFESALSVVLSLGAFNRQIRLDLQHASQTQTACPASILVGPYCIGRCLTA